MIDVEFWQNNKTTVYTTYFWDHSRGEVVKFVGIANRAPEDKFDKTTGLQLALSRALEQAARYFARQANGRVKHADWRRQDQLRRAAKDPDGSLAQFLSEQFALVSDDPVLVSGTYEDYSQPEESRSLTDIAEQQRAMAHEEDNIHGDR